MKKTATATSAPQVLKTDAATSNVGGEEVGVQATQQEDFDATGAKIVARLTPAQYWEWRTTAAELQVAERELDVATAQSTILTRELEIARLRMTLHAQAAMPKSKSKAEETKAEYQRFRSDLEKQLGVTLADKVIDESFAVKDLGSQTGES